MPTATTTLTSSSTSTTLKVKSSMNGSSSSSATATAGPSSSTSATLRSMYNRAAKAFLNRDISLTNSLLHSAFTLIPSPLALLPGKTDALCSQRRKWEILRITMETTIYASPRNPADPLPQDLREMLIKSPHSLVQSMYTRSLELFTPTANGQTKRDSAYLPSQVLTTLIYSSLKLDCPDVGRKMIEEWLARWGLMEADPNDDGGYDKVIELYTLQVLPKVHDWVYAKEFLDYETELPKETREALKTSLHALHEQYLKSLASPKYPETPTNGSAVANGSSIQRSHSPASSSSSLSTTSTHTAVPSTPRQPLNGRNGNARSPLASRPRSGSTVSVSSSDSTATATPRSPQRRSLSRRSASHNSNSQHSSSSPVRSFRSHLRTQQPIAVHSPPSAYSLVKAFFQPYLTTSKLSTFFVLFIVFPLVSLFFRRRRRAAVASERSVGAGVATAELVRRRLQASEGAGMVGRVWGEVVKAVLDTVKMGGSGLV